MGEDVNVPWLCHTKYRLGSGLMACKVSYFEYMPHMKLLLPKMKEVDRYQSRKF